MLKRPIHHAGVMHPSVTKGGVENECHVCMQEHNLLFVNGFMNIG